MSTQDPDATLPARGFGTDATAPVTRPDIPAGGGGGQGGTPPGGGDGGGMWDEGDDADRRRLWFIAGGVLVLGILVGTVIALAAGGGDKDNNGSTSTSSSSTSTSSSSSTSTSSTTTAAGPQILQFTANPSPVTCPEGGGSVNVNLVWATTNTTGVTISIDGPAPYGNYGPTDNKQFPFACPAGQHTYLLTANGTSGQKVQEQIVVQGIVPATTTPT